MVELNPSKLGTKDYWDSHYSTEITNFVEFGDKGDIWFGEDSAYKMIDWTIENIPKDARIGDLGCGNGHLLFELGDNGYKHLVGMDYSPHSIELCQKIRKKTSSLIDFVVGDLLDGLHSLGKFDLLLDKGTFDAISLAQPDSKLEADCESNLKGSASNIHPAEKYVAAVYEMLNPNGVLLITSCNWTEAEIMDRFKSKFKFKTRIPYPTFQFGGVKGQTITTVAFTRLN